MSMSASQACPRDIERAHTGNVGGNVGTVLALVLAIGLWGANWPVMKIGLGHVSPPWFSALRFGTGAACLFLVQIVRDDLRLPRRRDLPFVLSIGVLQMMLFTALGAVAMTHLPAGRSAILSYTTPPWVAPASVLFFGERLSAVRVAGIALAAAGVAISITALGETLTTTLALGSLAIILGIGANAIPQRPSAR